MESVTVILICLLFSAFFSGMEIAFIASNKLKIELDKKQGFFSSKIISVFSKNPSQYIATMLVGNNIALVVYGIRMAIILEPVIWNFTHNWLAILVIQTIVSTLLILVTAEFLPKAIFRAIPNTLLNTMAVPVFITYIILYPFVKIIVGFSYLVLRILFRVKITTQNRNMVFGKIDLGNLLDETTQNDTLQSSSEIDRDIKIFQNALDFSEVKLRECFVPRPEIEAMDINSSIDELRQRFIETGFSKILIYENSIDNIIGYVHSSELFNKPEHIRPMVKEVIYVPESMAAQKLLTTFIQDKKNIAVVVDEFGGTAGVVTIEDIIEEIFGEIEDEHDIKEYEERQVNESEFIFSGRLEIDHINEKFNLKIPVSENYETLAGFILFHHENIPDEGEEITIKLEETYMIKILTVSDKKIELLNLKIVN
ncbi:MAG: HlyC/CorC family transporter [Bacteroidia bacterium]|nr:HlyC/CorC family transporter [Bacteroidia bacterium]